MQKHHFEKCGEKEKVPKSGVSAEILLSDKELGN